MDWLKPLEEKVAQARATLDELRKENRTLRSKLRRLEQKKDGPGEVSGSPAWEEERREVRRRVESLVEKLEKLVEG
jgi:50S ribosomal subunit-associated GTPase HflX